MNRILIDTTGAITFTTKDGTNVNFETTYLDTTPEQVFNIGQVHDSAMLRLRPDLRSPGLASLFLRAREGSNSSVSPARGLKVTK